MTWTLRREGLPAPLLRDLGRRPAASAPPSGPAGRRVGTAERVDGQTWLDRLPRTVADAMGRWGLRRDETEPLRAGNTALVVPVLRPQGAPGVLKVGWPHDEADTEHLALRAWKGRGAVTLLAADPASATLLLERLDADLDLMAGSVVDTTQTLGRVLSTLDRPAPPWAPTLSAELGHLQLQLADFLRDPSAAKAFPRSMVQQALSLTRDLLTDAHALDERLVHTDLHQMNVLWRPDPGEWVAIDPKPMAGDPHWAVAPALWNRWDDVLAAHDPRAHLQLRLGLLREAADLDEDRARAMTIVRLAHNAILAIRAGLDPPGAVIGRAVTIIKAMQPG